WLKAKGFEDPSALTDTQRDALKAAFDAEQAAADSDKSESGDLNASGALDDYAANLRKINAEESVRVAKINAIAARHPGLSVKGSDGSELPLAAHAIAEGWDADKTELHALRHSRPAAAGPRRGSESGDPNLQAMVAQASLMASSGLSEKDIAASFPADKREQVMNAAAEPEHRGATLHVLMDSVIAAAGRHYSGKRGSDAHIRAAVEADRELKATGFSTMSLSTTLGNTANKVMIAKYRAGSAAWRAIARVRNHTDFKAVKHVRVDASGAFREIAADGELKHVKLEETAFENKLGTYGAINTWTRQDVINDDLGAHMAIYEDFGDMAASRIDEAVFKTLLANPNGFFSVGNGNLLTGADSALSIAALESAETLYSNQVNTAGRPINHTPSKLLTGTALQVTARNLYRETSVGTRPAEGTTAFANNPHVGKYEPVVSPWLNNTAVRDQDGNAISGQSATQWYLFADPNVRAAMAVAFLNGRQEPFIEAVDMPGDVLGFGTRAYADFGVGMEDPNAAVRSAGA
ncbi:hypothetical protein, partial [Alienimonas sp. DA493]|uniref:phage major capsid protein n=1 Tax=Alienimonas sp. DA493 TaxID=3373605 RepID=UPI003754C840